LQVFRLPIEEKRRGPDYMGEKCIPLLKPFDHVVVVALLHESDVWKYFEDKFGQSNIAITRALWNLSVSINLRQSFSEVIESARYFNGFETRLFGPQEDELGEEGI
jgi:hypothetical protein